MSQVPVAQINAMANKKIGGTNQFIDMYLVYQFVKRIVTPFDKWPAYQLGIIDEKGKVLKQKRTLKSTEEKRAWGYFDIVCANLKKILAKVPGGRTQLASVAAAVFLFKEQKNISLMTNEVLLERKFISYLKTLNESDMAVNNVSSGAVQFPGSTPLGKPTKDDPTAKKRKKTIVSLVKRNVPV
jgi:hypothetical protein